MSSFKDVKVAVKTDKGIEVKAIGEVIGNGKVVLFGLPGAFTPTCTASHYPGYEECYDVLKSAGVAEVYCVAPNDLFVMEAWQQVLGLEKVKLISDGNLDLAKYLKIDKDFSALGFGIRHSRYSLLVENGEIKEKFVETIKDGAETFEVSHARKMLETVAPKTPYPERIAVFTKTGCPSCAQVKEYFKKEKKAFNEITLDKASRSATVYAVTGCETVPQVFINGKHVPDFLKNVVNKK